MNTLKNWLLVGLVTLAAVLDIVFDFIGAFAVDLGLDPKISTWVRAAMFFVGLVLAKLQLPTTNPEKLKDSVRKLADKQ